jgi:hypothetical protein
MLPHEIKAAIAGNSQLESGYQNMLNWIAAGGKHGSLGGLTLNEAVVRTADMPWGENVAYDAAGNVVSMYRPARPGEWSYGGGGPSAPEYDPAKSAAAHVPWGFTSKGIAGQSQSPGYTGYAGGLTGALGQTSSQPTQATLTPSLLAALGQDQETEEERQARLLKAAGYGASIAS